jgi:hypothetical protein
MNKARVQRKECRASIGYEIRNVWHDVVWVPLAHYIEIPVPVPTSKDLRQSVQPSDGFFIVVSSSDSFGCDCNGSTHHYEKSRNHIGEKTTT